MYHARHAKPHQVLALVVTLVALLALGARVVDMAGGADESDDPDLAGTEASAAAQEPPGTTTAADDVFNLALRKCRSAWETQGHTLGAAHASLTQWRTHVRAMNQLVAGKITAQQASSFWSVSRTGAAQRVARYQAMDVQSLGAFTNCSSPLGVNGQTTQMQRLATCRQATLSRDDVLLASRVAIGTWQHHIQDMELLRAGKLSPSEGLQRWNNNWKHGVVELHRYRALLHAERRMAPC
jgi:hypothetical protein